jgi:ParB-like chromosome segregation protein Spo0J
MDARAIVQEAQQQEMPKKPRLQIAYRKVSELIPYVNNARLHPENQIASLAGSIREFDFNQPILIDPKDTVIAGHARLMAAKLAGLDEVPTIQISHLDPVRQKAYILADNRIAMDAEWDKDLLRIETMSLKEVGYDLSLTGMNTDDLKRLEVAPLEPVAPEGDGSGSQGGKMIECPSCKHRFVNEK